MLRLALLSFLLTSCSPSLVVYTDYHTHKNLASYNVGTPDPALKSYECLGQSLVFEWIVPKSLLKSGNIHVDTYVRLRDTTEQCFTFPICCVSGHFRYDISGDDYFNTGGIFTFYSILYADDEPIKTVIHPLYTPLIKIETKKQLEEDESDEEDCSV